MRLDRSRDALRYGVFYALAKADIESPTPIDSTRTWRFWTKYRNQLTKFLAENYPPQFIAKPIIDANSHSRNLGDIADHYNVSSDFFLLFLDERYHFYSCAERPQTPATFLLGELFFSDFALTTLRAQIAAAEAAGFRLVHGSTHDYRPSWKAWYDRLATHRDEAVRLVGVREYNRYLTLFVLAWKFIDEKYATIHRLAFEKLGD